MSKKIKERRKKEKRNKFVFNIAIIIIIIAFVSLSVYYLYSKFFAPHQIESFFPKEISSLFLIKSNFSSEQGEKLRKLGLKFEDEKYFENFLEDLIFPKLREQKLDILEEKLVGWRGDFVAVGNIKLSDIENISIFVIQVKNPSLCEEFLKILEENLSKRGYYISSEDFRGAKVTTNRGLSEISYALYDQYLLVSSKPDGVKKMIDTARGKFTSMMSDSKYFEVKKKLEEDNSVVFSYFDPLELVRAIPFLDKGSIEPIKKIGWRNSDFRMGISFIPHSSGIEAKIYSKKNYSNERKSLSKLAFAKKIPAEVLWYFEGKEFQPLIENLFLGSSEETEDPEMEVAAIKKLIQMETGFDLDQDLFKYLKENYASYMLESSKEDRLDIVLLFETKDSDDFARKLGKFEETAISLLQKSVAAEEMKDRKFTSHNYQNIEFRYLNMPDKWKTDLCYGQINDYFFIASSEEGAKNAIDVILERIPKTLSEKNIFKTSYNLSKNKNSDMFFYGDIQNFTKYISFYLDVNYEELDRKFKILETLNLTKEEKRKDNYYNLFLKIE